MGSKICPGPAYKPEVLDYFRQKIDLNLEGIKLRIGYNHHNEPKFLEDLKGWERRSGGNGEELIRHSFTCLHDEGQKRDLEASLERLDTGMFGFCQKPGCGKVIPFERLDAIPQAKYCLNCQVEVGKTNARRAAI